MSFLKRVGPDERRHQEHFSGCEDVQQASELVFGRGDFGIFLSMFSCLWGEALRKYGKAHTVEVVSSFRFMEVARDMRRSQGFPPFPCAVIRAMDPHRSLALPQGRR